MEPVDENPSFPQTFPQNVTGMQAWTGTLVKVLLPLFNRYGFRLNRMIPKDGSEPAEHFYAEARSADPSDPPVNRFVIWQSDGTGTGDDGDVLIKITDSNGTTKTATLADFSAL